MSNVANVSAGKPKVGGAVSRAPIGTELPVTASAELNEAFKNLGYCSEDGFKNNMNITTDSVKAWGGDEVLNPQTEKTDRFTVTLIEVLNIDVLKTVFGDNNVSGTLETGITINVNSDEQQPAAWVTDMVMRGNALKRIVVPNGKITAIEEITYDDSDAVSYGLTISAQPDSSGNTHYEYIQKSAGNKNSEV